jgi:hypothetical protein
MHTQDFPTAEGRDSVRPADMASESFLPDRKSEPSPRVRLAAQHQSVYDFLKQFHAEQDQLPPTRVIAEQFGWASPNAAVLHLKKLHELGLIEHNAVGKYRFTRTSVDTLGAEIK